MLASLPIDLGQGCLRHTTAVKRIAFQNVPSPLGDARALDIGCGDGYWSDRLHAIGYDDVISIDIPRTYPNEDADAPYARTMHVDANAPLPFPDKSFDLVWCSEVLEHLERMDVAVAEIRRVLVPGGTAIVTTPNSYVWFHYLLRIMGLTHCDWQNQGHIHFFHYRDIRACFPRARIAGYFPYTRRAREVVHPTIVRWFSPSFVVVDEDPKL